MKQLGRIRLDKVLLSTASTPKLSESSLATMHLSIFLSNHILQILIRLAISYLFLVISLCSGPLNDMVRQTSII